MHDFKTRRGGVLLHPTSLWGGSSCGGFGKNAEIFLGFLKEAGCSLWQMLPFDPPGFGDSPYQALSVFAFAPHFLDSDRLVEDTWISEKECPSPRSGAEKCDFQAARCQALRVAAAAWEKFGESTCTGRKKAFHDFRKKNHDWLEAWAFYSVLKEKHGGRPWWEWEKDFRDRRPAALKKLQKEERDRLEFHRFVQFLLHLQWEKIRCAAKEKGVLLIGDLPFFPALDSCEVWWEKELFDLKQDAAPRVVAGVPPDYFSETGQRWGNPVYRWGVLKKRKYDWWKRRLQVQKERFDYLRLDHFLGFHRFWEIPAEEETALRGRYRPGPGADFFENLRGLFPDLPFIAEDLGVVIPEATSLRKQFGLPGMRVLQFAFGVPLDPRNPHLPENHEEDNVVYTGTHDNDTAAGWFEAAPIEVKDQVVERLNGRPDRIFEAFLQAAWRSKGFWAIAPVQDVLGLGSQARMNRPGSSQGNWCWRLKDEKALLDRTSWLKALSASCGRV